MNQILSQIDHRPWPIPTKPWKFYQEWKNVLFLHWQVKLENIQPFVPKELPIDLYEGKPWVSIVAFDMINVKPRYMPQLAPISNFRELNIRTYILVNGKPMVYFLSIEASNKASCKIAQKMTEMPYRYSKMEAAEGFFTSNNKLLNERFKTNFTIGDNVAPSAVNTWLTERYGLGQDSGDSIYTFEIHHEPWPLKDVELHDCKLHYSRFSRLLKGEPNLASYSPGVNVVAWGREILEK